MTERVVGILGTGNVTVGFQGEGGAFSEEAAHRFFGPVETRGYADFDALVDAVAAQEVKYGLLPCENTIHGPVVYTYDLLSQRADVKIADECSHRIVQCLIGVPGATLDRIERVSSHPVALGQCRRFFEKHPYLVIEQAADTAGAVRTVVERGDPRLAAIGPRLAAHRYHGTLLAEAIQDVPENTTRFLLITRNEGARGSR